MTKQEFEERTGAKVTKEEYAEIEQIYLNSRNMDKDDFCRNWKTKGYHSKSHDYENTKRHSA